MPPVQTQSDYAMQQLLATS